MEVHMRKRSALALLLPLTLVLPFHAASAIGAGTPSRAGSAAVPWSDRIAPPALGLRLSEIDYDQPGFDTGEFVEIVNVGTERYRLRHVALVFVNGSTSQEYRRVALSGRLGPARRLVVASTAVAVEGSARVIALPLVRDNAQNGAPDGIALVNLTTKTLIDAISYEGAITAATIDGSTYNLVEGTVLPDTVADSNTVEGSLSRIPNGTDTNNAATDWSFTTTTTRGAANVKTP